MATIWVNFAEVRSRVTLEMVLTSYYRASNLTRAGNKLIGPCPVHNGTSPRAFHADLDKNVWHCFSKCQKGGNQLDLVAIKDGVSIREAAIRLQAAFLGASSTVAIPSTQRETRAAPASPAQPRETPGSRDSEESEPNPPLSVTLNLSAQHPHLTEDRKLPADTITTFGVGYCTKGIMRGMIAIPIRDEGGTLVAYAGRRLRPSDIREFGKYKFPKGFRKDRVIYNLDRVRSIDPTGPLVLVEGFFSVLALYGAGIESVGAIMGCELSEHQAQLAAEHVEVVLLFDGDEAGRAGASAAGERLRGKTTVRVITLPEGHKPDTLDPKAIRWLIRGVSILNITELSFTLGGSTDTTP